MGEAIEKRYQVFVSSTYRDLTVERREVMQALLEINCIPAGMELFPASDADSWSLIQRVIDECDYYIVIVGGRYGSTDGDGISFTEKEYDYATSLRKPIAAFLHKDPAQIPIGQSELKETLRAKLSSFRSKIEGQHNCKYWTSTDELGSQVVRSMVFQIKTKPAEGWVRGSHAADPAIATTVTSLQARVRELEEQLSSLGLKPPEGAAELSQGKELMHISFSSWVSDKVAHVKHSFSWDEVFGVLGPVLYDPQTESTMHEYLSRELARRKSVAGIRQSLEVAGFQRIKIQLQSLGLIVLTSPLEKNGQLATRWQLTPYGQRYLASILAVRHSTTDE